MKPSKDDWVRAMIVETWARFLQRVVTEPPFPRPSPDQVREQLSKGRIQSHKVYCFRKPPPDMFERDVWVLYYGPEVPGMGRLDVLRVTFTDGKTSSLEIETLLCP